MYERFSDRLRTVFKLADKLAIEHLSEYVCPEHLLLGLLKEAQNPNGGGEAAQSMRARGISVIKVKKRLEVFLSAGTHHRDRPATGKLPPSPAAKRVIENMCEEANHSHDSLVGTWHLLLVLSNEDCDEKDAAQILAEFGMD